MKSSIATPPRTMMEVFKSLPEGTLAELIDNKLYMSPSPIFIHQKTIQEIFRKLSTAVTDKGAGEVIISPFDVYLDESQNAVQPDILVVLNYNRDIIDPNGHIHGIPDMIVEVLSPGNKQHDLIVKKELYERFGVNEYWIVDPDTKLALGFKLTPENKYQLIAEDIGLIKSFLLEASIVF
jgi:Uma2 family endonuclease